MTRPSRLYDPGNGRPAIALRLMVGLHYLKHLHQLSDEDVVAQWMENRYWQHLCGSQYFEPEPPIRPASMTKWRAKIAAADAERLLAEMIVAGLQLKIVKPQSLQADGGGHVGAAQRGWSIPPTRSCTTTCGGSWRGWRGEKD